MATERQDYSYPHPDTAALLWRKDEITATAHSDSQWVEWPVDVTTGFNTKEALNAYSEKLRGASTLAQPQAHLYNALSGEDLLASPPCDRCKSTIYGCRVPGRYCDQCAALNEGAPATPAALLLQEAAADLVALADKLDVMGESTKQDKVGRVSAADYIQLLVDSRAKLTAGIRALAVSSAGGGVPQNTDLETAIEFMGLALSVRPEAYEAVREAAKTSEGVYMSSAVATRLIKIMDAAKAVLDVHTSLPAFPADALR